MRSTVNMVLWVGALAVIFAASGCSGDGDGTNANVIRIGAFQTPTSEGDDQLLAAREINRAGGISIDGVDYDIELVFELQGTSPAEGVAALQRMIERGATAAEGTRWSSVALGEADDHSDGVAQVAAADNFLLVSGSASSAAISDLDDDGYFWRTMPSDAFQGIAGANYAYETVGARRVAILYRDDVWGTGLRDTFTARFEQLGGQVVAAVAYDATPELNSYAFPELDEVFAGMPDAVYLLTFQEGVQVTNRIVQRGDLDAYGTDLPAFLGADGILNTELLSNGAPAVVERLTGTSPFPDPQDPDLLTFLDAYEAEFGDPDLGWPYTYDAIYLIALAMQAAQSTDPSVFKAHMQAVSRDDGADTVIHPGGWLAAREALLAGEDVDFSGASGPIDFTAAGDPSRGRYSIKHIVPDGSGGFMYDNSEGVDFRVE